jgi:hypothetical protein
MEPQHVPPGGGGYGRGGGSAAAQLCLDRTVVAFEEGDTRGP